MHGWEATHETYVHEALQLHEPLDLLFLVRLSTSLCHLPHSSKVGLAYSVVKSH